MLEPISNESLALMSLKAHYQSKGPRDAKKPTDRDSLWCTYCKKPKHTIEKCWKLHGKPSKGGPARSQVQGQAYMAGSSQQSETRDLEQEGEIFELSKTEI